MHQCARIVKFCMSANSRTLVLDLFHKILVPCSGFLSFLCIREGNLSAGYPFWCYGGPYSVGDMDRPLLVSKTKSALGMVHGVGVMPRTLSCFALCCSIDFVLQGVESQPPPPPKSAAEFGRPRRFVPLICWVSEFRPFVLPILWVSVILPIRSADLLGLLGL